MEVSPPAPRSVSPRKNSQEDREPPEPSMPASSDVPTTKTNGHSEQHDDLPQTVIDEVTPSLPNGNGNVLDEASKPQPIDQEMKDTPDSPTEKESSDHVCGDETNDNKMSTKQDEVDSSNVSATPSKRPRTQTSRSQRELNNLVIDTPKKEEPVVAEDAPRSRFGRVHKPKGDTPLASASKKKVPIKPPQENVASSSKEKVVNGTPLKAKETKTPSKRPSSALSTTPPLITSAPERRIVYFNPKDRIKCSRAELLTIPPKDSNAEFSVGDLAFSKVTGYPFWPCMITIDPLENKYSRLDQTTEEIVYHVQYFGDETTRGWTRPKNVIPFEGLEKYKELQDPRTNLAVATTPQSAKKGGKFKPNKYAIEAKYRKNWEAAVAEAEFASKLNPQERIEMFTFDYKIASLPEKKESQKRKVPTTPSSGPSKAKKTKKGQSSPEDIYNFDMDDDDEGPSEPISSPFKLLSAKNKGDFKVYKQRELAKAKKDNPKLADHELDMLLHTKWSYLSDDQKAIYVDRSKSEEKESKSDPEPLKVVLGPRVKTVQPKTPASLRAKATPKNSPSSQKTPLKKPSPSKIEKPASVSTPRNRTPAKKRPIATESAMEVSNLPSVREEKPTMPLSLPNKSPKKVSVVSSDQESQAESIESSEFYDETTSQSETASEADGDQAKVPLDEVCYKCFNLIEAGLEFVSCNGPCLRTYHIDCVSTSGVSEEEDVGSKKPFKCSECSSGQHSCFICGQVTLEKTSGENAPSTSENTTSSKEETIKCNESCCGRFYHVSCLTTVYPFKTEKGSSSQSDILKCPLHFCLTCHNDFLEDNIYRSMKRKLLTCVQCPTAYHFMNDCLAAGSTVLVNNKYILCPEHLEKASTTNKKSSSKSKKFAKLVNVSFCFACMKSGELVCCEKCPAAFHKNCLEFEIGEGSFTCPACTRRKQLRYGDLVWAKVGNYRWWPARIVHPYDVPDNLLKMNWKNGEFVAYFFGSHDYQWIDKRRVFLYEEEDSQKPLMNTGSTSMDKSFKQGLKEAKEAFAAFRAQKLNALQLKVKKWPPYRHLRANRPVGDVKIPVPPKRDGNGEELHKCECAPESENPCSSDEDCLNRLMMIECNPKTCNAGDKCCNQRFKKREFARTKPFNTGPRGWGLKALENIKQGQFVIEYAGELISERECEERLLRKVENNEHCFYFLTMDKNCVIDAGPSGNLARFMNHSCDPNCKTVKWIVEGTYRMGLFAVRDINAGEELTFNYNLSARGEEKTICTCGASNCSQFIGVQPKKQSKAVVAATPKTTKKSKTSKTTEKKKGKKAAQKEFEALHEDLCFFCDQPGQLIMCDRKGCPKVYDLACIGRDSVPRGRWECPWHHCDVEQCGKTSTQFCSKCPSSFCTEHKSEAFKEIDGKLVCPDHGDTPDKTSATEESAPQDKDNETHGPLVPVVEDNRDIEKELEEGMKTPSKDNKG